MTKHQIQILITIFIIFLSYTQIIFLDNVENQQNLIATDYSLKTYNISPENKWSRFADNRNGTFYIHSGEQVAPRGVFTFKKNMQVFMTFSIRKSGVTGEIEFKTIHNGKEISLDLVTRSNSKQVVVFVEEGDSVEVIADKYMHTGQDHGKLQIKTQPNISYEHLIIPILWSLFFVFLKGKKHTYIAINSYLVFVIILLAEKLNFGVMAPSTILMYTFYIFSGAFIFVFMYQELNKIKVLKLASTFGFFITILFSIIPLISVVYYLNFDVKISKDVLYAIFQSNSSEAAEYIYDFVRLRYIALVIVVTGLMGFLLYQQERKESEVVERSVIFFMIFIFISFPLLQSTVLPMPKFVISSIKEYRYELDLFKKVKEKRSENNNVELKSYKKEQNETYLILIGESLNKNHMGLYGYLRDTTPLLNEIKKDGELMIFNNIYSNHTHTIPVLQKALTESNQYNKIPYYDSFSIIDVLKKAGIETFWLTNQTIYSVWDNLVSVIAAEADNFVTLNSSIGKQLTTQEYDEYLIDELKNVLANKSDKNKVIFVHLMGNHGSYESRYPNDSYSKYHGSLNLGEFGTEASKVRQINEYDNSVLYNDYVVSSMLKEFQKEKGVKGFIYISDHADDVIGRLGHNSGKFTYHMTQVPMITWFSNSYQQLYKEKYYNLLNRTESLFSSDMFYDTMLGVFGVQTDRYDAKYDFSSNNYTLKAEEFLVLDGKKSYIDSSNYIYWQKENIKFLLDTNQSSRVMPHRINSIGKLKDVWKDGARSFELDVKFEGNNQGVFRVGHNEGVMGVTLERYLNSVDSSQIEKVWLDFKNLNPSNYQDSLKRLKYLDEKFNIKSKFIVESSTIGEFFNQFNRDGWHTSYYLPTGKIVKFLKEDKKEDMDVLASRISRQVSLQELNAVSFDHRLYPFVKKYLEPTISKDIVYHIWYSPRFDDVNFRKKLLTNELYLDLRVKTLLGTYRSQFDL